MADREVVADYVEHYEGEREVVDWDRLDADGHVVTYRNVPLVYLRRVTQAEYLKCKPDCPPERLNGCVFWEVSVD